MPASASASRFNNFAFRHNAFFFRHHPFFFRHHHFRNFAYKHEWEQELARRAALGTTGPEPPHPDDIVIDMNTDQVTKQTLPSASVAQLLVGALGLREKFGEQLMSASG